MALSVVVLAGIADGAPTGRSDDRIIIKFEDIAEVRLRNRGWVSLSGHDLDGVLRLLEPDALMSVTPLFGRPEIDVDRGRRAAEAEARSGRALPDLNGYYEIRVEGGVPDALLDALGRLKVVETAYRAPLPAPPPVDIDPPTPDGESGQVYLDPAPEGIDARAAWTRPGGRGEGVLIIDIEFNWRDTHEDLDTALGQFLCFSTNSTEIEHGTAVLGELVAGDNGYGVTGIANQADIGMVTHIPVGMSYSVARAIECATGFMGPGDVLLIEAQTVGPNSLFVPPEWDAAEYDAITVATAAGIVVVETAGNGNEDLDGAAFGGAFDRSVRDSGALIVGAGANLYYVGTQPDLSRLDISTYGSRVDLQGWGDDVLTTGYGDVFDGGGDPNQYYTELFNGTSSAAPMIAGAAAIVQGVQIACGGSPLDPIEVRELLVSTGTPQVPGPFPGNIGPRPNLAAALARVDVDNDQDGFAECAGDCDDAVLATHPGAPETNDGLDNQCPGEAGFGSVDEVAPDSGFHDPINATSYSWTTQAGATTYEVARSTTSDFSAGCLRWETSGTSIQDAEDPSPGVLFHYLVRALNPFAGSWGQGTTIGERSGACL
ncbi:MAG: S8 family serine peptidase [Acidobacteria bacterium]|nr:S8 family serine peptidase [Acidobacteriota bacterium]NIM63782.1 S8 family serine peptidase [Acidobacteriota bacterium]NIO58342.1 S8 family serine peptidase [Acidobacteriota bacterium]NIQ29401.1 S8 family serine peptidase [Acidobacteriota bacterium]NIT10113.1 S8 family serine peptidase [Acidobacteriota bacterium]